MDDLPDHCLFSALQRRDPDAVAEAFRRIANSVSKDGTVPEWFRGYLADALFEAAMADHQPGGKDENPRLKTLGRKLGIVAGGPQPKGNIFEVGEAVERILRRATDEQHISKNEAYRAVAEAKGLKVPTVRKYYEQYPKELQAFRERCEARCQDEISRLR